MPSIVAIPAEIVSARKVHLQQQVDTLKQEFIDQTNAIIKTELKQLPKWLLKLSTREFLCLLNIFQELNNQVDTRQSISKKRKSSELSASSEDNRRITRSMARTSSIYVSSSQSVSVPATPQLHPLLPETPAMLRKAIKANNQDFKRPARITRSTIKISHNSESSNANKENYEVPPRSSRKSTIKKSKTENKTEDSTVLSFELEDGNIFDVDLSKSPDSLLNKNLGIDTMKELRNRFQSYAAKMGAYFKKFKI